MTPAEDAADTARLEAEIERLRAHLGPPPRGFRWVLVAHVGPEPVADEGCETLYGYELRPLLRVVR